ncbi:MAG: tRNA (guanosine(37)-N1)-methyltransferase TrmD [Bacteroidota bacterium]|nr:tRNA (guanosine(37)-N1)-methyltransferase TrmD [Rhodothermia bacterium]MCS7155841.1 tRNA (guanosine(37)-N1)-methyltransferase TrmD [Bacteroidota bacterium]MDW8138186.1 tRNA (guanosine(37)-N1)-methyltransferase TrmD [Bacteroidota bacterium]MDW8285870.1 tRNA (guanosine(37)-N1)-methyltransferase TrmD [Bacteroidota bacterium]
MRVDIISAVPGLLEGPLRHGVFRRAQERGRLEVMVHNLRDYGIGRYRQIDDYPYGGGAGMVLRPEPIFACVERLMAERSYDEVIYLTPDGVRLTQALVNELSLKENLIVLCGHYKGVDERVRQRLVTREISIGDYVLSGGELAALVLLDAVVRLLPGVLGDAESALTDSFQAGMLDAPWYTRPAEFRGMRVPEVLRSGNHEAIRRWREEQALQRTRARRPDLLEDSEAQA